MRLPTQIFTLAVGRDRYSEDIFIPYLNYVLFWYRFINDWFIVWTGTEKLLIEFIQQLNIINMNLHSTWSHDDRQISFLDLMIIKQPDGTIGTDLYCKPTASNTLLHASSAHPRPLVRSIPYMQYMQLRKVAFVRMLICYANVFYSGVIYKLILRRHSTELWPILELLCCMTTLNLSDQTRSRSLWDSRPITNNFKLFYLTIGTC